MKYQKGSSFNDPTDERSKSIVVVSVSKNASEEYRVAEQSEDEGWLLFRLPEEN